MKFSDYFQMREMAAVGPYIGSCTDTATYVVQGACSDQNTDKKNRQISAGHVQHKIKSKSSTRK